MSNPESNDPTNPAGKPQGTLRDQQETMESEGQPGTSLPDTARSADPAVNAASIFEKLEEQAASERGDEVAESLPASPELAPHPKND